MRSTLCIIDMQPYFDATKDALPQVLREIERAKKDKIGIVVLEFAGCGKTAPEIQAALKKYRRKTFTTKHDNDGSFAFVDAAAKKKFSISNVRVVGVNRGYCVKDTVASLVECGKINSIDIITDATNGRSPDYELQLLKGLSKHYSKKVKIV